MHASPTILETDWSPILAGPCITSPAGLWRWLASLGEGEQLALAICIESCRCEPACTPGGRRRRAPTDERTVLALRFGGKVRLLDAAGGDAPLREVSGAHDLAAYFDDALGFAYVQVRARRLRV